MSKRRSGVERAVEWFGSIEALAKACRVKPVTVRTWRRQGFMSRTAAHLVERLTEGKIRERTLVRSGTARAGRG